MPGTDARSLSSLAIDKTHKDSLIRIRRQRSNPNFARKSPIRSMDDFDFEDCVYYDDNGHDPDLYISDNMTIVFWNLDDYPITVPADYGSIGRNIKSALRQMGFWRLLYMVAYGDKRQDTSALEKAGIVHIPAVPEDVSVEMALAMTTSTSSHHGDPVNLVVIAKQSPKSEFNRVLHCLQSRNNPVIIVQPPGDTAQDYTSVFLSVDSLVDCTQLLGGENPKSKRPQGSAYYDNVYDSIFRWRRAPYFTEDDCVSSSSCDLCGPS